MSPIVILPIVHCQSTILSITETNAQVTVRTFQAFSFNLAGMNSLNNNANGIQTFSFSGFGTGRNQTTSAPPTTANPFLQLLELYLRGFSQVPTAGAGFPSFPQVPRGGFQFPQYGYPYYPYYGGYGGYGYYPYSYYYYYYG
uniref:Spore coat protein n=2 Tax=Loa loa TaxID=7209 RepID=A0A1I7VS95_LOALO